MNRRCANRWLRNVAYTSAVCLVALGFLMRRGAFHAAAAHRIGLEQAEKIALSEVPKGRVGVEEFHHPGERLAWTIDVRVPHSTEIREIEIDAATSRVLAMRTETAKEEARELAMGNGLPNGKSSTH
ncbi:MAG TPA: PepSY domain-containing protein [Chthoniobacterales bacterium]